MSATILGFVSPNRTGERGSDKVCPVAIDTETLERVLDKVNAFCTVYEDRRARGLAVARAYVSPETGVVQRSSTGVAIDLSLPQATVEHSFNVLAAQGRVHLERRVICVGDRCYTMAFASPILGQASTQLPPAHVVAYAPRRRVEARLGS